MTSLRFENMWLKMKQFKDLAKEWVGKLLVSGFFGFVLASKLKVLKGISEVGTKSSLRM